MRRLGRTVFTSAGPTGSMRRLDRTLIVLVLQDQ